MSPVDPLSPEALYTSCTLDHMDFTTTDELEDALDFIGQDRAVKAMEVGVSIDRHGYNIFALGPSGTGKHTLVRRLVEARAAEDEPPGDWCYVNNFAQPYIPNALRLPAGRGRELKNDMDQLVEDLRNGLMSAFESEEYQTRRRSLEEEFQEQQQERLQEIQERARERDLALIRTPSGLAFAPVREGEVVEPENFQQLPEEERKRIQEEIEELQQQLQRVMQEVPRWERDYRSRLHELNQSVSSIVINDLIDSLMEKYEDLPQVVEYLKAVREDVGDHLGDFLSDGESEERQGQQGQQGQGQSQMQRQMANMPMPGNFKSSSALRRYQVNVLVDAGEATGVPVIYESNPSYLNLVGRVEQMAMMGALITDFTLIKPGMLHKANGGYLLLDADKVLTSPYAWEGLKRALQFGEIRIESPVQMMSMTSTVSLEPEPIELDVKVILMGDRYLYYLLSQLDPDFHELFKIAADFDDEFVRDETIMSQYAHVIATVARRESLHPFDRSAVCRVIEQAARLVEDSERVTARMQTIVDLLEESDHWAKEAGVDVVSAEHVQAAVDAQVYRMDRMRERMQEQVLRETVFIDTSGEEVGQINGLSVLSMGMYAFGRPSRITATIYMGRGDVINIEREVELSGPIHDKGVLIMASYLRSRYAENTPLSLNASLVFEQSYGGIDGDSASSTELYALLSAIAETPIRQGLAVTGSVNQLGEVQAIGGANQKIEGFFDLCKARGLTGDQGVLIPASNVKHLMLRHDVVEAVRNGQFHIYPVSTIDEGVELLTGMTAGEPDEEGVYPEGTFNRLVADRLAALAAKRRELDAMRGNGAGRENGDTG